MILETFDKIVDDVAAISGLTTDQIYAVGSVEALGNYYMGYINSNVNVAQYKVIWQFPTEDFSKNNMGDGDTEITPELYYGALIPMIGDNMRMQYNARFNPVVERLEEGDSKVWFREPVNSIGEPDRKYQKLFSKYRKLRTL